MSNSVQIIGHLGSDPVTRVTAKGTKITTFSVATNSRKGGEDVTIWWSITIWGDQFDYMLPYLRKGSSVFITGKLKKPEIYEDKEGNKRITLPVTVTSIDFLPTGKSERSEQTAAAGSYGTAAAAPGYAAQSPYGAQNRQTTPQRSYGGSTEPSYGGGTATRPTHQTYGGLSEDDSNSEDIPF